MTTCPATTIWPEVGTHGARLRCALPVGHDGEHLCAEIEYLPEEAS